MCYISDTAKRLCGEKVTGKVIITINMNQGGIGSIEVFKATRASDGKAIFAGKNGIEHLIKI